MKFLIKVISKMGVFVMVLVGMVMGRIAANFVVNMDSSQLNTLIFTLLLGSWMLLFVKKVVNRL